MMDIREFRGFRSGQHPYNQEINYSTDAGNLAMRSGEFIPLRSPLFLDTQPALAGARSIHIVRRNDGSYNTIQISDISLAESIADLDERENLYFFSGNISSIVSLRDDYNSQTSYTASSDISRMQPLTRIRATIGRLRPPGSRTADTTLVATYLTPGGEESAPSLASPVFSYDYDDPTTALIVAPNPLTLPIETIRVYMSINGELRLIHEQPFANASVTSSSFVNETFITTDSFNLHPEDTTISLDTLSSTAPPIRPPHNFVNISGGRIAAVSNNSRSVFISEAGNPISFPYEIPIDRRIVRIMRYGDDLLVLTDGRPSVIVADEVPREQELPFTEPCISAESAVDMGYAIFYLSYSGICMVSGFTGQVMTMDNRFDGGSEIINVDEWQELNLTTVQAANYRGQYIFYYREDATTWKGLLYSPRYQELMNLPEITAEQLFFVKDPDASVGMESLEVYQLLNGEFSRFRWNAGEKLVGYWEREYQVPQSEQFVYGRVTASGYEGARITIDGISKAVPNDKIFTLPQSKRSRVTRVRFESRDVTQVLQMAYRAEDLY